MELFEVIQGLESMIERELLPDEIVMVGRMHEAGKDLAAISAMLDKEKPQDIPDGDVGTVRYEYAGPDGVRRIE